MKKLIIGLTALTLMGIGTELFAEQGGGFGKNFERREFKRHGKCLGENIDLKERRKEFFKKQMKLVEEYKDVVPKEMLMKYEILKKVRKKMKQRKGDKFEKRRGFEHDAGLNHKKQRKFNKFKGHFSENEFHNKRHKRGMECQNVEKDKSGKRRAGIKVGREIELMQQMMIEQTELLKEIRKSLKK